ncbi:MAG: SiaB family protein kinase [Cyclobacteriaceae bacterium]|nr:SiaB family protein kinase [Cyclobacteriaceae bacterium]
MLSQLLKYERGEIGEIMFSYKGNPGPGIIHLILQLIEVKLDFKELNPKTRKRIIIVLVEILQNILHHKDEFTMYNFDSFIFYLFRRETDYLIVSGNYIRKEKASLLMDKLQNYTALSDRDLRDEYLNTLGNGVFSPEGGAGLGLLEIIRKSGGNLENHLIPVNDDYCFFLLEVKIAS